MRTTGNPKARLATKRMLWVPEGRPSPRRGAARPGLRAARRGLILADRDHIVRAEGFGLDELQNRIEAVTKEQRTAVCLAKDPQRAALAGEPVIVHPLGTKYQTDAEGKFTVRYVSPADPRGLYVHVRHTDPDLIGVGWLPQRGGDLKVVLAPAVSMRGHVADPNGKPIAGAQVAALPMSSQYVLTDAAGAFDIAWSSMINNRPRVAEAGRIVLRRPILTLSGTVVDVNDRPVSGIKVGSGGVDQPECTAETDAQGRFTLRGLCRGGVEVWAKRNRFLYGTVRAEAGRAEVKVVARPIP